MVSLLKKTYDLIENIQRRFTKRIVGIGDFEYEQRLRMLKLPSLEYRRRRGDMIEMYKIMHKIYDVSTTAHLFTINTSCTRGHPFKLRKVSANFNLYLNFFTNRVVNNWNSLPEEVVMSGSVNAFKNALDRHWADFTYEIDF